MTLRILLADDQALLRGAFRVLIDAEPGMAVAAEAGTGREAVALARTHRADVILMDIRMPDIDGITATNMITEDEDLAGVKILTTIGKRGWKVFDDIGLVGMDHTPLSQVTSPSALGVAHAEPYADIDLRLIAGATT